MRRFLTVLMAVIAVIVNAQIVIDGRKVMFDSQTNTMLATVPKSAFNSNYRATIELEDGWKNLKINGTVVGNYYTFSQVKAGKSYAITIQNPDEYIVTSSITFTFLPILHLEGTFGYDYQEGRVSLYDPDGGNNHNLTGRLKWRGSSTNSENKHKRNYKIKLDEDISFFGLRNDNDWILDAGQADMFRVRNRIATEIWNDMARKPYYADKEPKALSGVRGRMVEVFLNKQYRGIYCLTECMDRKQMKLKKIDKETETIHGCLYKAKGYGVSLMWNKPSQYDNHSETWETFEVKYPDLGDIEATDWSTLYDAINFVVNSSDDYFRTHVSEYFDMPVMIDYYILLHALNAYDNRGKNMYWAVYDKAIDKKLTPVVWDLDGSVGQKWIDKRLGTTGAYTPDIVMTINMNLYSRLNKLNPDNFVEAVNMRYNELRKNILSTDQITSRYMAYYDAMALSGAAEREENLWSEDTDIDGEKLNLESEIYYITYWLARHLVYLDENRFKMSDITTGMKATSNRDLKENTYYNIQGQRLVTPTQKGLYIKDGRKIIIR